MAEPATLKTTLAVAAVAALGPLAGEYMLIALGAFGGALLNLMYRPPLQKWHGPLLHVGRSMVAALLFTSTLSNVAAAVAPAAWGVSIDLLWIPVAAMTAMWWREAILLAKQWATRIVGKGDDTNAGA